MPPVKVLEDQLNLVKTSDYPSFAHFPFEFFNPVQSRIFDIFNQDANVIIAASTSSGKTICSEMVIAHEVRVNRRKAIYLAPLKALAQEKIDDWTSPEHHFGDLKLAICTGDYRLTEERKKELDEADIIVMTNEMLASRCRNFDSELNHFLKDVGVLVADEFHLIGTPGRGSHTEVALMKFSQLSKSCRLVFLSATLPNVQEMAEWASYVLNSKETFLIKSTYRPCPLGIHYEEYEEQGSYKATEQAKVDTAMAILNDYPEDKFLIFTHTKETGRMMCRALDDVEIKHSFHNAELDKNARQKIEKSFRTDKDFRVVVATSTLAWGCNFPARRVIILGVHRGMGEVEVFDIIQEVGRAGRTGYDPRGDAYILIPSNKFDYHKNRIETPQDIKSKLLEYIGEPANPHYKNLAFHLVSEIHQGGVKTKEDVHKWAELSLAYFQIGKVSDSIVDKTLDLLQKVGAIRLEGNIYEVTSIGKVASLFYYSPFDVADLRRNFRFLFQNNLQDNDLAVAMALGNVDTIRMNFVSRAERDEMSSFMAKIRLRFGDIYTESAIKGAYAYFSLMNGISQGVFASTCRGLQVDFPRAEMVLNALDSMAAKWNQRNFFRSLGMRITYGVSPELLDLCRIPDIGKVRAEKLYAAGFRTAADIVSRPEQAKKVLNMKGNKVDEIIKAAASITS